MCAVICTITFERKKLIENGKIFEQVFHKRGYPNGQTHKMFNFTRDKGNANSNFSDLHSHWKILNEKADNTKWW